MASEAPIQKTCRICGQTKPITEFYPRPRPESKDGYRNECKQCHHGRMAVYRTQNREKVLAGQRAYYWNNRDKVRQKKAEYRKKHLDKIREKDREYAAKHREEARQKAKRWYENNPERAKASRANWRKNNSHKYRELQQRRRARIRAQFVASVNPDEIYRRDKGICQICGQPVSRAEMSLDHIVPISKGGVHASWNVRLAHIRCNIKRGAPDVSLSDLPAYSGVV